MATIVTAKTCYEHSEALVVASYLQGYGVMATLPDQYLPANVWHMAPAWQGSRVWVMDGCADEARELLRLSPMVEESAVSRPRDPKRCGRILMMPSYIHSYISWCDLALLIGIFVFFGVPMPVWRRRL